ncbi:hypothetical protein [Salipiger thiooxidans]|uniref:hypothetical protein n=1 Tax=Salipiger thiooxidans TaxID=282683 RepID=UPI001CD701A4|nr:hypothetical protein [Salipiger thiooxidans]MCA0851215.1 hypothetical protein [Salipiger thiooxidans]
MADRYLTGNGRRCSCCAGTGWIRHGFGLRKCEAPGCRYGRIALSKAEIVAATLAEAAEERRAGVT